MIEHSKKWAAARGLVTKNEVHGEDEWRIPVHRNFEHKKVNRQSTTQSVNFVTKDPAFNMHSSACNQFRKPWNFRHETCIKQSGTMKLSSLKDADGAFMDNLTDRDALL